MLDEALLSTESQSPKDDSGSACDCLCHERHRCGTKDELSAPQRKEVPKEFALTETEEWWRDQSDVLLKFGYELRARFRPGWMPSWLNTKSKRRPMFFEDFYRNNHPVALDAKRVSDGKRVVLKQLRKGSKELDIARYMSSDESCDDPMNHCVPILDVISDESVSREFMVMPLLLPFDQISFWTVDEVIDFMKQTLEGLVFLHDKGVAHRDCSDRNIMMFGDALYPKGFHPSMPALDSTGRLSKPRRRRDIGGVKYYFTDFGISSKFDGTEKNRLVTGDDGLDQDVPELSKPGPYDPFPVDVFILGNVFRRHFSSNYENLDFLSPLVECMTQENPEDRPSARSALQMFNEAVERQHARALRWVLIYRDGSNFERFIWHASALKYEAKTILQSCIPSILKKGH